MLFGIRCVASAQRIQETRSGLRTHRSPPGQEPFTFLERRPPLT